LKLNGCRAILAARSEVFDRLLGLIKEESLETEDCSPELLSKVAEIMPLTEDNILLNLLVETVAIIPLNTIEFSRLSIAGLQYLLS